MMENRVNQESSKSNDVERRDFLKQTVATTAGLALSAISLKEAVATNAFLESALQENSIKMQPNMIGGYGPWAANIVGDKPARLSFLQPQFKDVGQWRKVARQKYVDCLAQPTTTPVTDIKAEKPEVVDGLHIERISWQLPYGERTKAVLIKPAGATGKLPAVLGLHDHGGNKFFGHEKITKASSTQHPLMTKHQEHYYGGQPWANALARRGYAVLVHDTFAFASRRVRMEDVSEPARERVPPITDESAESIQVYNKFASEHEHLMAKSLFCAGTTWPGVFVSEDQRALDYLCSRDDVDATRVGCAGLSGGGLRTVYLGGLDDRIRCACCVGMMSTWRDYLLNKCFTHTWMIYIPGLPLDLDYPEILGLRVPLPTMVLNDIEDSLFTLPEMERADGMLKKIYEKAGAADRYRCEFYPGPHKFDLAMQSDAFGWFDRWLKA
jgi:dienelactone hydrolase